MSAPVEPVRQLLSHQSDLHVAFAFGSMAHGAQRFDSDLDVAVAAHAPLSSGRKLELIEALAELTGRPVDLIDLQRTGPLVFRKALTTGVCVLKRDASLYAELLRKLWYDHADLLPLHDLILRRRRERFVDG